MNQKLLSLLLAITMIFSLFVAVNVAAEEVVDPYSIELLNSDFESYVSPDSDGKSVAPSGWKLSASRLTSEDFGERGRVVALHSNPEQSGKLLYINYSLFESKILTFEGETLDSLKMMKYDLEFCIDKGNSTTLMLIHPNASKVGDRFTFGSIYGGNDETEGYVKIMDTVAVNIEPDIWYNMQLYVNGFDETITLVFDGSKIGTYDCDSINGYTTGLCFSTPKNDKTTYFDNVKVSVIPALKIESAYPQSGCEMFPCKGGSFKFVTDREVLDSDNTEATLHDKDGVLIEDAWVLSDIDVKEITVSISNTLDPSTTYILKILGKEYSFTTSGEKVITPLPEITEVSGGYKATATVENTDSSPREVTMVVASYYTSDNKMYDYAFETKTVSTDADFEKTVSVPAEDYYIKSFFVDNLSDINMLREDYAGGENLTMSGTGKATFTIDSIIPDGDNIVLKGTASEKGERTVVVKAVKQVAPSEDSEEASLMAAEPVIDFIAPVTVNEDGSFELSFAPNGGDGWYDFEINGAKLTEGVEESAYFITLDTQTTVLGLVNGAEDADDVKEILGTDYRTEINVDEEYYSDNGYQVVFEQKPYETYPEIPEMLIKAKDVLDELSSTKWNSLSGFIGNNDDILMYGCEDYEYYADLKPVNQNKINKVIQGTYDSFTGFRKAFSEAVDAYKTALRSAALNQQISGGGGSGSGNNTTSVQVSGGGGAVTRPEVQPEPPKKEEKFADLGSATWAKEPIEFLADKGIISGDGNGNFRPLDSVSREEFVKMLVNVFGISALDNSSAFTDSVAGAWYAPYLAAAKEAGIVQGREDGSFGVGEKITRQDMAVMLQRAIEKSGKILEGTDGEQFADAETFADYAKNAIAILKANGLISGVGEGKFAPGDMANRAQAAQMIYNLFGKEVVK